MRHDLIPARDVDLHLDLVYAGLAAAAERVGLTPASRAQLIDDMHRLAEQADRCERISRELAAGAAALRSRVAELLQSLAAPVPAPVPQAESTRGAR